MSKETCRTRAWLGIASAAVVAFSGVSASEVRHEIAYLALDEGSPYWQVWVMDRDGAQRRQVTRSSGDKSRCSWAPDGKRLLVNTLDGLLYWVDIELGTEEKLAAPHTGMTDAVLSPDGRRVAYSVSPPGTIDRNQIWMVDLGSADARQLTSLPGFQQQPTWSPEGDWIYFLATQGEGLQRLRNVWRVSVDGSQLQQVTNESRYSFAPDVGASDRLAYSSNRSGDYELYVQALSGGGPERWTDHPALDSSPSWAPDADSLLFHSTRAGRSQIYRIREPRGTAQALTTHSGGARDPMWLHQPVDTP